MNDSSPAPKPKSSRVSWKTILTVVVLVLVFAYAVEKTQINLEKPLDPARQESVIRVLRLLADPDLVEMENGRFVGPSESVSITIDHIIETILMALMASTIGTVLAMPISFIAARNLMAPVTAPLAAIMAGVLAAPIGGTLGLVIGGSLMQLTTGAVGQPVAGLITAVILTISAWALIKLGPPLVSSELPTTRRKLSNLIRMVLALTAGYLSLGILAQLGNGFGEWLIQNLGFFSFIGTFFTVMADTLRLGLPTLTAFLFGLLALSYGSRYGQEAVLQLKGYPARLLTGVLTGLGTAVIIYSLGAFLNWLYQYDKPQNWTTNPALILGAAGLVVGVMVAPKRPFAIGLLIYTITRGILNILRSIEPLIMGIVFVVWVSLGPFAGVMALTLHSIASLGKLFSEQVEGIDEGPLEAITATGANKLQLITFGVIPQIIPPFIAFALYRWDINVRMSTIIGFVGGGGIGFVLSQNIQLLRYRQASVMMISIALVVGSLDYVSSKIRARII